jgi:hypothetical protein
MEILRICVKSFVNINPYLHLRMATLVYNNSLGQAKNMFVIIAVICYKR